MQLKLVNFRSYENEVIDFDDLTVFVGKNDAGKSSILEALDIFFNDGENSAKPDRSDIYVHNRDQGFGIGVVFEDLPDHVIIDDTVKTTLESEYLLNRDGNLEIIKRYGPSVGQPKFYVRAYHPRNPECANLLQTTISGLKKIVKNLDIKCEDLTRCSVIRKAIWKHIDISGSLDLGEDEIHIKGGDAKEIWDQLARYLPVYALFQSDRSNSDGDSEIRNPLKWAVERVFKDPKIQTPLNELAKEVRKELLAVSQRTLAQLKRLDPSVSSELDAHLPAPEGLKWADVFKNVSI